MYISAVLTPGVGAATMKSLLTRYGGIADVWAAADRPDVPGSVRRIIDFWTESGERQAEEIRNRTAAAQATICVWEDEHYPASLRPTSNPPPVLYVRGDIRRLTLRALALVGTTDPDPAFARVAAALARRCAEYGIHVVSGLARGIDATALRAAVEAGVPSFAVVGHGIDFEYPASSAPIYAALATTGAVISQFPTGHAPQRWTFPMRNEVMCTLAYGTVIVQGHSRDGSLIQADFSFKHGRDVLVYAENAGLADNAWVTNLVGRGARLFTSFEQIIEVVSERHEQFRSIGLGQPEARDQLSLFATQDVAENDLTSSRPDKPARCLLVDIDGVVADTQEVTERAALEALSRLTGRDEPADTVRGRTPYQIARQAGLEWRTFRAAYNDLAEEGLAQADVVLSSVIAILREARAAGWKIAAVTSQPRRRTMLTLKDEAAIFDTIITWNDTPRAAKPAPDSLLLALKRVGGAAERSLMIGDSHNDLQAARAAKVLSVAVLWGYESAATLAKYSPDYVAATADELREVINGVGLDGPGRS